MHTTELTPDHGAVGQVGVDLRLLERNTPQTGGCSSGRRVCLGKTGALPLRWCDVLSPWCNQSRTSVSSRRLSHSALGLYDRNLGFDSIIYLVLANASAEISIFLALFAMYQDHVVLRFALVKI
jgi:hypothetical protein